MSVTDLSFLAKAEAEQLLNRFGKGEDFTWGNTVNSDLQLISVSPDSSILTHWSKNDASPMILHFGGAGDVVQIQRVFQKQLSQEQLTNEINTYERLFLFPEFPSLKVIAYSTKTGDFLTETIPGLQSLDNTLVEIFNGTTDPDSLLEKYRKTITNGVIALVRLHRIGILHEDIQPKNLGIDLATGVSLAFDFERSIVTSDEKLPVVLKDSLQEISEFLQLCKFYCVQGYFPDDPGISNVNPYDSLRRRLFELGELSLTESDFTKQNMSVLKRIFSMYQEEPLLQGKASWNENVEHILLNLL